MARIRRTEPANEPVTAFVGSRLRALRHDRQLSAQAVADELAVAVPRVYEWETGTVSPSPHNLAQLAAVFDVDPVELLDVDPDALTLVELRVVAGFTRRAVAARLGVGYNSLYAYETGLRRLGDDRAKTLARLYRVPVEVVHAAVARLDR